jgi:hypothetical protein
MSDTEPNPTVLEPPTGMSSRHYTKNFLYTALLLLVLSCVGNIQSHLCLDGQEPAVSMHFENLSGHPEHAEEEQHVDVENDLVPQVMPGKTLDQDSPLFLIAVSLLLNLEQLQPQIFVVQDGVDFIQPVAALLPPLRAPPIYS